MAVASREDEELDRFIDEERVRRGKPPGVRSTPMVADEERRRVERGAPPKTATQQRSTAIAVAGLIIGCILWPIGARYSIDGVFWLINMLLSFLRIPIALITPPHYAFYCLLAPIPYLCSRVEWHWPVYRQAGRWRVAPANVVVTWIGIAGYDLGTTFLGVRAPQSGAAIAAEIAASGMVAAGAAAILTFGPEWLVRRSWQQLRS